MLNKTNVYAVSGGFLRALGMGVVLAFACAEPDAERGVEARAGGIPDGASCEGACGGYSDDGCWCDELCDYYGDCCSDKVAVCDGGDSDDSSGDSDSGDTTGGDTTGGDTTGDSDVPDNSYCAPVDSWNNGWSAFEEEVLDLVNIERAQGANCGGTNYGPVGSVGADPALRCSARKHSKDMVVRSFFGHTNPDGENPFDRMQLAGYSYWTAGENIAAGQTTPAQVVQGWMNSPGHCKNIMNGSFTDLGVGYYPGGSYGHYWTQNFGLPQ